MALVNMKDMLWEAKKKQIAIGAFEFWSFDSARAIVSAAEEMNVPVILQAGPLECDHTGIENLAYIAEKTAQDARVDVALHLDHGDSIGLAKSAMDAGFTSVMIDTSSLPLDENIAATRQVVQMAHEKGISVEGEIGVLGGNETGKDITDSFLTDPAEAQRFVTETEIDAVAVAIGTAHGVYLEEPKLHIDLLREIVSKVNIPVVLHGGSGVPEEQVRESIRSGVCKVNICTELLIAMGQAFEAAQKKEGFKYSVPSLFLPAREAGHDLVMKKLKMLQAER